MVQLPTVLPCHRPERHKKVDYGSKEVLRRIGEELVASTASYLSAAFVQGCKQGGSGLGGRTQIGNVLTLYRIHPVRVLHIGEVYDVKLHVFRDVPKHLILVEMVEGHLCKLRKLVIIQD